MGELIDDVTDLEHAPLPVRIELALNGPHLPRSTSPDQALQARRGACEPYASAHAVPRRATSAGTYHAPRQRPRSWPAPRRVYSPSVDARWHNRSSTGAQARDHAAFSPRPPRGPGNTLTGTARQRGRARRLENPWPTRWLTASCLRAGLRSFPLPALATLPFLALLGPATV